MSRENNGTHPTRSAHNPRPITATFSADTMAVVDVHLWRASRCLLKLCGLQLPGGWKVYFQDVKTKQTASATGGKNGLVTIPRETMATPGKKRGTVRDSRGRYIGTIKFFVSYDYRPTAPDPSARSL